MCTLSVFGVDYRSIEDPKTFCGLPGLTDLYLGDNQLKSIEFDFSCIEHLRFLDLQYNKLKRLDQNTLQRIDSVFAGHKTRRINLNQNPWVCDCYLKPFIEWTNSTKTSLFRQQVKTYQIIQSYGLLQTL